MGNEFLILLRNFSTFSELAAAVIGSIFYYKYKDSLLKYFLFFLWFTLIIEFSGYIFGEFLKIKNNKWLFNIYSTLSFLYLMCLYWKVNKDKIRKLIIKISILLYLVVLITYGFIENYILEAQTMSYIVGSCVLILSIIFYFVEILTTEKVLHVKKNLLFWVSIGLLLFHVGGIPFNITINYYADLQGFNYLFAINFMLIIIMNLSFIIGFICSDKKQLY